MLDKRLTEARTKSGLSIYALSKASGVGVATISEIESGKNSNPGIMTVVRLAHFLDCTLDYLVGRSESPTGETMAKPRRKRTTAASA